VPDESDDEWLEEGEQTAVAPEGEKLEVEAEAGKKDQEKADTAERDVSNEHNCIHCTNCVGGTGTQDVGCSWLVVRATCLAFKNVPAVFE